MKSLMHTASVCVTTVSVTPRFLNPKPAFSPLQGNLLCSVSSGKQTVSVLVFFPGCPGAKKREFLTSVLDALSTDMVHAVSDPSSPGRCAALDLRAGG